MGIENGTANASLIVNTKWYSISHNRLTGKINQKFHTSTVEFNDSVKSQIYYIDHLVSPVQSLGMTMVIPIIWSVYHPLVLQRSHLNIMEVLSIIYSC